MIVKIQRPMDDDELPWLAYDEAYQHPQLFMPCDALRAEFGSDLKRYYEAELIDGWVSLRERVADQPW